MELYEENLLALMSIMDQMDDLASIEGVFEVEVRVRIDDVNEWAVIGYGEAGDPCILRFEQDKPAPVLPNLGPNKWAQGGFINTKPDYPLGTVNAIDTPYDFHKGNLS